jgi:peptidyl-prolyl cis-trans isomerase C
MNYPFRRLSIVRIGAAAAMLALSGAMALAQDDTVVATINGEPVTEADIQIAIEDLDQQFARLPEEQRRAAALSAIIEIRLMSSDAEEKGMADNDAFQRRMKLLRERALHSAYIEQEIAATITDEAVRARYDEQIAATPPAEEVRARHIIVETEDEAKAIIADLDAGGDFEAIAKEKSKDGAAAEGGDLGYFAAGQMVPEFEQAAFALEVGTYTKEPVQTQFGWHVIKVEDKRTQEPPAFDQVAAQFRSLLLREAYAARVAELRDGAEIAIDDADLKAALEPAQPDAAPAAEGEGEETE